MSKLTIEELKTRLWRAAEARDDQGPVDWEHERAVLEYESAKASVLPGTSISGVAADGLRGDWVLARGAQEDRCVLYLHGGGYVIGSSRMRRALASRISAAANARVFVLDYRLAPEFPYPAALQDAMAAWEWLLSSYGVNPRHATIAGDSAGGGLAAATILALKEGRHELPAATVLLSPWVDLTLNSDSYHALESTDPLLSSRFLVSAAESYAGFHDVHDTSLSPVFGDWRGAPPMLVQVGSSERLLDDSRALAVKAEQDGVHVVLEVWEEMVHVWHAFGGLLVEADEAVKRIGEFVSQHTQS